MSWRMERIGEQIRGELARMLREEISDPRIGMLTLTRVEVAPDFATASVYWSQLDVSGEEDVEVAAAGLESAAGFLRKRLAKELSLRRTPALRFRHDPSIERGAEMLALLEEIRTERHGAPGDALGESASGSKGEAAAAPPHADGLADAEADADETSDDEREER